jgi:hypothetical protein
MLACFEDVREKATHGEHTLLLEVGLVDTGERTGDDGLHDENGQREGREGENRSDSRFLQGNGARERRAHGKIPLRSSVARKGVSRGEEKQ